MCLAQPRRVWLAYLSPPPRARPSILFVPFCLLVSSMMVFVTLSSIFFWLELQTSFLMEKKINFCECCLVCRPLNPSKIFNALRRARLSLLSVELRKRQVHVLLSFFKFCNAVRIAMTSSALKKAALFQCPSVMSVWCFCPWTAFGIGALPCLVISEVLLTSPSVFAKNCELLFEPQPPYVWFCAMQ